MTKGEKATQLRDEGASYESIAAHLGMSSAKSARRLVNEHRTSRPAMTTIELAPEWGSVRVPTASLGVNDPNWGKVNPFPSDWNLAEYAVSLGARPIRLAEWNPKLFAEKTATEKPMTHLVLPDLQAKPGVDLQHLVWAGKYIAEHGADVIVQIGDAYDMESLSEYDRGKKSFEGRRYKADIEAGNRAFELFEEGLAANGGLKARKVFTLGNHEQRIERALELEPRLEGVLGYEHFNVTALGWESHDFLKPVEIDGLWFSHYWTNAVGRPLSGAVENMLRQTGCSFVQGHQQGLRWGRRELPNGKAQMGLVAGSFYSHHEDYRGPQGNDHWRGIVVLHEVHDGDADIMSVSIDYLKRKFS